jgi:4a-hydroxytetrahydrobiopterin dehydratase
MALLAELKCTVCLDGDLPLSDDAIRDMLKILPGWSVKEERGMKKLARVFKFKDFLSALDFTRKVGLLAEEEDHHPMLVTEWGEVTVFWWTHKVSGLHQNDFIMAAKTDKLYSK